MKNKLFPLSIIIITNRKDELFNNCLESCQWADEIIVGDNNSKNDWETLQQKYHFSIVKCNIINDFSLTRNELIQHVKNEWILFVDSDEIISKELKQEIQNTINSTDSLGFFIIRKDVFIKKVLQHGEVKDAFILRLMKKNSGQWQGKVHEQFIIDKGKVTKLHSPLFHYPHQSVHSFIAKINWYSTIRANELVGNNVSFSLLELCIKPIGKFFYNYFFKLGFLDGWRGLIYALVMSLHSLVVRVKLYEISESTTKKHLSLGREHLVNAR